MFMVQLAFSTTFPSAPVPKPPSVEALQIAFEGLGDALLVVAQRPAGVLRRGLQKRFGTEVKVPVCLQVKVAAVPHVHIRKEYVVQALSNAGDQLVEPVVDLSGKAYALIRCGSLGGFGV